MRYYIAFKVLILFSLSTIANASSLIGILKLKDGKPVTDATIFISDLSRSTLTDENGRFEFPDVKYGNYKIEAVSIEIKKDSFFVEFNESKPITLVVESSNINLKEVTVTALSKKKELETQGFAVSVIETQKMALQSIQTNELLERTAGVKIRQDGGLGSNIKYNINGLSGEAIRIFINGNPASNYGSSFSLNSIPPALIERIEVYKGVVPGYLSEDALGGAINIILKQRRAKTLTTSYSIGSFNTHQWNMAGSYRWNNGLTVDANAFYNYSDNNYKVWGDDIFFTDYEGVITESYGKKVKRFHDAYESLGSKFNIGFTDVKWADQFLIGGILSKDYKEVQNGKTMRVVYGDRHNKRRSGVITLNYDKKDFLLKGLSLKVDASHSYLRRQTIDTVGIQYSWAGPIKNPDGTNVLYTSGAERGNSKNAEINRDYVNLIRGNLNYRINDNHGFYLNYLFNDFVRKVSDEYQPVAMQKLKNTRDYRKEVLSFTYENLSFSNRLRTDIFYKHYFQKAVSNEPEYNNDTKTYSINKTDKNVDYSGYGITISFALLPKLYLLGSAERALRMPTANELFGNGSESVLSAIHLNPERSNNVNIGVNIGPYDIENHSFNITSSVYYRDTKDMIREGFKGGSYDVSQYENLDDVLTKGIDAEFNYNYADKINFRFSFSKMDVLFNRKLDAKGDPYLYYHTQIRNEPSFKFNGNLTYYHSNLILKGSKASVHYNLNYVNKFNRDWDNVGSSNLRYIPAQYPMDLGMTYHFPKNKIILSLDAKNFLNEQAFDNYGLQKPGRAFYAKITYKIF